MLRRRAPIAARLLTGPLGFLAAGLVDVTLAWARWGASTVAARLARRLAR